MQLKALRKTKQHFTLERARKSFFYQTTTRFQKNSEKSIFLPILCKIDQNV